MTSVTISQLEAIAKVMLDAGEPVAGPLIADLIAGGRSNLSFRLTDGSSRWVMRTPPLSGRTPSAHDVGREFRVTAALKGTDVPVPRAVVLHEGEELLGGPFAISEFVRGVTVQTRAQFDQLAEPTVVALVNQLVTTLATLHRVDHAAIGLSHFGRPDAYASRQLKRWQGQWETVGPKALGPLAAEVVANLQANVPDQPATSIVHGDFRIDNTLIEVCDTAPRLTAVLDWELSTIGDPVADVALMCAYRHPSFDLIVGETSAWTSPRLPDIDGLAAAYEAAGGVNLAHWEFHLALAYFKLGVIAAGIDHRFNAGAALGAGFDTAGESVQTYLELALANAGAN